MSYSKHLTGRKQAPAIKQRTEPEQVVNHEGGYVYNVGQWGQLERFILIGTLGGTYYVGEAKHTEDNLSVIKACIAEDPERVVKLTVALSESGRPLRNDQAILVAAHVMAAKPVKTAEATTNLGHIARLARAKDDVCNSITKICRIGTHIFMFVEFMHKLRGWGRAARRVVSWWYQSQTDQNLGYQMAKYQSRVNWKHSDLIRLSHAKMSDSPKNMLAKWALQGTVPEVETDGVMHVIGLEKAKVAKTANEVNVLIDEYRLTREMIPTNWHNDPAVQRKLFDGMPMTALIRNLGNLSRAKLFEDASLREEAIARITNEEGLRKGRIHPITLLIALKQYQSGHGFKSDNTWPVEGRIIDALDAAFYASMRFVVPTGQRILLALDVSGSMHQHMTHGTDTLTCAEAGLAMGMVMANVEPLSDFAVFGDRFVNKIPGWSPKLRLDQIEDVIRRAGAGGSTNMGAPVEHVLKNPGKYDAMVFYTDSETWLGTHPQWALDQIRQSSPNFKVVEVAAAATDLTGFRSDPKTLTINGFDGTVPQVIDEFLRGE